MKTSTRYSLLLTVAILSTLQISCVSKSEESSDSKAKTTEQVKTPSPQPDEAIEKPEAPTIEITEQESPKKPNEVKKKEDPEDPNKSEKEYAFDLPYPNLDDENKYLDFFNQCGAKDDTVYIDDFVPQLPFQSNFITNNAPSTVLLQWSDDTTIRNRMQALGYSNVNTGNVRDQPWCTGTIILGNKILTAGHCVNEHYGRSNNPDFKFPYQTPSGILGGRSVYAPASTLAPMLRVRTGFKFNRLTQRVEYGIMHNVTHLIENGTSQGVDYAILQFQPTTLPSGRLAQVSSSTVGQTDLSVNNSAAIIQHPGGGTKHIHTGKISQKNQTTYYYNNIDTKHGSSGAAILDSSGSIRGVHTDGGCRTHYGNRGVTISEIRRVSSHL